MDQRLAAIGVLPVRVRLEVQSLEPHPKGRNQALWAATFSEEASVLGPSVYEEENNQVHCCNVS